MRGPTMIAVGSYGAIQGASTAAPMISATSTKPITPVRLPDSTRNVRARTVVRAAGLAMRRRM